MKMKRKISTLLCAGVIISLLTGCGGEYAGVTEKESASGAAVSGTAINEETVSGSAVKGTERKEKNRENWYCSETNFYYAKTDYFCARSEIPFIMEWNKEDGTKQKIECKDLSNLCYVDDKWVYYTVYGKSFEGNDFPSDDLYRAPIEQNHLNIKKAEKLFTERVGITTDEIYCDGRYVAYISEEMKYKKYDLKEKCFIGDLDKGDKYYGSDILGVAGGNIYIRLGEEGGLYVQKLDSEKVTKITGENVWGSAFAITESDIYYSEEYAMPFSIMRYHLKDGSKQEAVKEEQVETLLAQLDLAQTGDSYLRYEPDWMFVSGDRLYIQFEVEWEKTDEMTCQKEVITWQNLGEDGELHYARELTECLEKQNAAEVIDQDSGLLGRQCLSRGYCIDMTDEKCYMYLYNPEEDKNVLACYNFNKGEFSYVDEEDMDWYLPYYAASFVSMEKFMSEAMFSPLENGKGSEWIYSDFY